MLRNKSKQALMADYRKSTSSIFSSPRLFTVFSSKGLIDTESVLSPTSILDTKPFSVPRIPCSPKSQKPENRTHFDKLDSRKIGLGIVDDLIDKKSDQISEPETRMVLFGSQLKIQIPPLHPSSVLLSPANSPKSQADFGIKTRNSQLGSLSPFGSSNSGLENPGSSRGFGPRCLSASEMELSEDYTRVVCYGPNPRTTHIFDDCVVESCCGVVGISEKRERDGFFGGDHHHQQQSMGYPSESFLSFCYACKKSLGHGKDIYMYRGEKAFCSSECRYKEMMFDEKKEENGL